MGQRNCARTMRMKSHQGWPVAASCAVLLASLGILSACGAGQITTTSGSGPASMPAIENINSATTPTSSVGLPIEINGSGFQAAPGKAVFTQGSITATVVPSAATWSATGATAVVPAGNGTSNFTVPGTVSVTVVTSAGTSNGLNLNLVPTLSFDTNALTWIASTVPLPASVFPNGATGLRAVAVPSSPTSAYVVLAGGYNGSINTTGVFVNTLAPDGTVGTSWQTIPTVPLPSSRAHHALVEADATNSLAPAGTSFLYVIGGQQNATDTPGGTNTVFMANMNQTTGSIGTWTQLGTNLPQSLTGVTATLINDIIYVVGGLTLDGTPSPAVYSAPIEQNGTLGAWTTVPNQYPVAVAFATAFGYAGKLYVVDGDPNTSTSPNNQGTAGTADVYFASASRGVVGAWIATQPTLKSRLKHITWAAFGQAIDAEGVYQGNPGSVELEHTTINSDGTVAAWNTLPAAIGANVYNATAIVSPLASAAGTPRFLLIGGQNFVLAGTGELTNKVYMNVAP